MNKIKVCAKIHLFIIISAIIIALGMAAGAACHFINNAGGFFNYGGEFSSYRCIIVTYYNSEYADADAIKPVCEEALGGLKAYETSYAETTTGGEIVYKYTIKTDYAKLESATAALNTAFKASDAECITSAALHEGTVNEGGVRAVKTAAIAISAAIAFGFVYFVIRYKLRAAFSLLLSCIHNLGLFVALTAMTRIPVGIEIIAMGAAVLVLTMIFNCLLFDRTRKNLKAEKYAKTARTDVVELSASETRTVTTFACCALAVASVVVGVFAVIASLNVAVLAPYAMAVFGVAACFYGCVFFTPAVHNKIDALCERVISSRKSGGAKKAAKAETKETEVSEVKEEA